MDKYHIYDEIGKGAFSIVYKGREKKKIEYVAIKRIEKTMMTKVRVEELSVPAYTAFPAYSLRLLFSAYSLPLLSTRS